MKEEKEMRGTFDVGLSTYWPTAMFDPCGSCETRRTFGTAPLAVRLATSGTSDSDGVTGGVYKTREHIHRAMLMRDY